MGEDEDQIRWTIGAYSQRCDDGRFDEWAELFTDDARFEFPGRTAEGRDAIRQLMATVQPPEARGKHITANSLVEVDGDTATATTDYVFVRSGPEGLSIVAAGRYDDELVRHGTRWRFRRRAISLLGAGPGDSDG